MGGKREEVAASAVAPLLVQELGGDVPERYVVRDKDRPTVGGSAPMVPIPVVDLGRLADGAEEEAAKLRSALESWGLFMITNHGVELSVMDAMMSASREFFHQPVEQKAKPSELVDEDHLEGYGSEQLKSEGQASLDWSDRLYLKVEPQDERSLHLWPEAFRDVLHKYSGQQCGALTGCLLPAMARLLGLADEGHFVGDRATAYARIIYYPPCPRPDLVLGVKPHSDATLLTVLMVDGHVGGLQVLKDGVWYDVPATGPSDALLVNVGDMMEIMSNGVFKSPVHQVVTNAHKGRTSVVLFYGPNIDKVIGPADELVGDGRPARYKNVTVQEYGAGLFEHLARGERVIDSVRI